MISKNASYEHILSLFEDFKSKPIQFDPMENPTRVAYAAPSSLHSLVTREYYGQIITMDAIRLTDGARAIGKVFVGNAKKTRFILKLRCMLEDWRKFANHIAIEINGIKIYENATEFFENINLSWPSVYYPIPSEIIKEGVNSITLWSDNSTEAGLYMGEALLLMLPSMEPPEQISCQRSVRKGDSFTVAVYTGNNGSISNTECRGITLKNISVSPLNGEILHLYFAADQPGNPECTLYFKDLDIPLVLWLPEVVPCNGEMCKIGIDCDDHRHDFSEEAERVLQVFAYTAIGNYFQFRPNFGRNYFEFPPVEVWEKRFGFLKDFNVYISLKEKESRNVMPFASKLAGTRYIGLHIHEPYLFFCPMLENSNVNKEFVISSSIIKSCSDFEESEKLYRDFLSNLYADRKNHYGSISVGSPSLLCIYEAANPNIDRIIAEPVSNCNLLYGAVRGVSKTEGKVWGCHIPPDWYFGLPTDDCKARKVRLAMNLAYIQGADFIYPENSSFKTNAFSREDWESHYTHLIRQYLRDLYDYVVRNPRCGRLVVENAVIYGRFDHFYWFPDDRIAELADTGDWDKLMWGKWDDESSRWCWRAIDAWLPSAGKQNSCEHVCNKKLFSGTPYGDVDIIPWWGDFSKYRTLALLGWNTMDSAQFEKMACFVADGGTLFVSWCHFNTAKTTDVKPEMLWNEEVEKFIGAKQGVGTSYAHKGLFNDGFTTSMGGEGIDIARFIPTTASIIGYDEKGETLYLVNQYGKGMVYFGTFSNYFSEKWAIDSARHVMDFLGRAGSVHCTNPNVAFTRRMMEDGSYEFDILNVNCAVEDGIEEFELYIDGIPVKGCAKEGRVEKLFSFKTEDTKK